MERGPADAGRPRTSPRASLMGAVPTAGAALLAVVGLVMASAAGLYDRDELVLRKTTLEEAPRMLAVAAMLTLVAKLGESVAFAEPLENGAGLILWSALLLTALVTRTVARRLVQAAVATERCLLIGTAARRAPPEAGVRRRP